MDLSLDRFRVRPGKRVRLDEKSAAYIDGFKSKEQAKKALLRGIERLRGLQEKLYAQDRYALLVVLQAMDAAGKDSTIEHVMSGVNPQGCQVFSFKAPSAEELDHDFLWRTNRSLPERGRIGVFNRSYYEEVIVVRVHPEILERQKLPRHLVTKQVWKERFEDINAMERYLSRNGTVIRKFFLHVSKKEQLARFEARLNDPAKNWKFAAQDFKERDHWNLYMKAYEDALQATSTEHAPWYVVPADHKWFTRLVVAGVIVEALEGMKLHFPRLTDEEKRGIEAARRRATK